MSTRLSREKTRLDKVMDRAWHLALDDLSEVRRIVQDRGADAALAHVDGLLDGGIVEHPFSNLSLRDREEPHVHALRLMRNPDYFPFTCKHVFNVELAPFQHVILKELWCRRFPMLIGSRGAGKSFILALYCMLRGLLEQGTKICIVGAAFRQAKVVFEYCESLWANAPILRDIVGGGKGRNNRDNGPRRDVDRCEMILGESLIMALPLGDGKKIRGQRANIIVADEFASIPEEIYENVVAGFAAVSSSPIQNVKSHARVELLKALGLWTAEQDLESRAASRSGGNQAILSGTAYYAFNHFAKYWRNYKAFIESRGERRKLEEIFGGEVPESFDWRDYSVIRLPVSVLPKGYMDEKHVARSRATVHSGIYMMEYGACFATDSDGFFRRSLIESCVTGRRASPVTLASGEEIRFNALLRGQPGIRHVIGVDPASQTDKFSIVVTAIHAGHRRVVYCWTTNNATHKEKLKRGLVKEHDFYHYGARKIRDLLKLFPTELLMMDAQGGGRAVYEALMDPSRCRQGERPIYEVIDPDPKNKKETDDLPGEHILELVEFSRADWVAQANHGLRKDLEDKACLFPRMNTAELALAIEDDKAAGRVKIEDGREIRLYDTLEDNVLEIEELKDELATIVHSQSTNGRDRWDTPETKAAGGKKGRLRKDRYSALLMANMGARLLARAVPEAPYETRGGFAQAVAGGNKSGAMYIGPQWFLNSNPLLRTGGYGAAVRRGSQ